MVTKDQIASIIFSLFCAISWSQEEQIENPVDSLKTGMKQEGLIVVDTLIAQKRAINPLAPSKAAFYSAVLPGLGQIYNKRYWKAPIVWGLIGGGIYTYRFNDRQYDRFRTAFKRRRAGFLINDEGIPETTTDAVLERQQNDRQNDRDLTLLVTILFYALNVVDANVDAHLKQFNIDDDLGLNFEFQPYLELNPITSDPNYGMALIMKF